MNIPTTQAKRVVSGMRPTGSLHLGHYHGVIKNWVELQLTHDCFFFVADWHALTTHYDETENIEEHTMQMIIDWLACGISPSNAKLFIQSQVPEHAELQLLLSMITPLSWLERVPSYKDQQVKLADKDLMTHGFLGYPLLQAADILIYKANYVPVGEDQVAHIELSREIARRFNHIYGSASDFEEKVKDAIQRLGTKNAEIYLKLRRNYQEKGDDEARDTAIALVDSQQNISYGNRQRLYGYLDGNSKLILPEPQALLTEATKIPGTDGQKMSKSYGNIIALREEPEVIEKKLKTMPTDPARIRRKDPGEPTKCPVWEWHQVYSDEKTQQWVQKGCRSADIGCLECKKPLIASVQTELEPIRQNSKEYEDDKATVKKIITEANEAVRDIANDTLEEVKHAIKLMHR
ncbi:MAG: tryptophan--tRNA ligase [Gammaproteobacteria bacterium]|nr:tryptophan--tRNA ligase [Gammaproteobacteria bacterium]